MRYFLDTPSKQLQCRYILKPSVKPDSHNQPTNQQILSYSLQRQNFFIIDVCSWFTILCVSGIQKWISSVQLLSCVWLLWHCESQQARPPCPSPTPGVYSNSCPSSQWCHPAISSSVVPFSSCPQSLPASGSFPMSQLFTWGGQSIGVSASASALPMNTQDWSPLGWTGWISLQSKGLSRVFSNTTVQKHQFFSYAYRHMCVCVCVFIIGGFPGGASGKEPAWQCRRCETWVRSLGREYPLEEGMQPTPVFLPGESRGQKSLAGYSP